MNNVGYCVTRYKEVSEVDYLKDIQLALVDKYYVYSADTNHEVGQLITEEEGYRIGEILDIIINDEGKQYSIFRLDSLIDFNELIKIGVPIENIIFDNQGFRYNKGLDLEQKKTL